MMIHSMFLDQAACRALMRTPKPNTEKCRYAGLGISLPEALRCCPLHVLIAIHEQEWGQGSWVRLVRL